jgi:uncharacterized protein
MNRREFLWIVGSGSSGSVLCASTRAAQTTTRLAISVASTGGPAYPMGGKLAELITRHIPGVIATVEVMGSGSAADSLKLLDTGRVPLVISAGDMAWEANEARLRGYPKKVAVRTLGALTTAFLHVVARTDSGIASLRDLRGKRLSTGPPGGASELQALRVLEACGLAGRDLSRQERLSLVEAVGALKDRKLDGFFWSGPSPLPAVVDLAATPGQSLRLVPHGQEASHVARQFSVYFPGTIPKGTYKRQEADVRVLSVKHLLMAHERLDSSLAYEITRLLHEHVPDLVAVHKAASEITLKNAVTGSPIPFHSGALRYYREKGVL